MSNNQISEISEKCKKEFILLCKNLSKNSLVIINKFSSSYINYKNPLSNNFDKFCDDINLFFENNKTENFVLFDINKVFMYNSISKSIDYRFFISSKAPYTISFFRIYVKLLLPIINSLIGNTKKLLVLDCDNTLWSGIIGEDTLDKIKFDPSSTNGKIFEEIHYIIKSLHNKGTILALCSKNNFADVKTFFKFTTHSTLNFDDFIIKKINWLDKSLNINDISKELNISTDTFVFLDDSDFEINEVKAIISDIEVFKVPNNLFEYPALLREISNFFLKSNYTEEDYTRNSMYKVEYKREKYVSERPSTDNYLSTLSLSVNFEINNKNKADRIAQLTQKTNQFNLSTIRYTKADILRFMAEESYDVFSISVDDKFGSYGLTGVVIVKKSHKSLSAEIDTFLLSCRVIGRKVETVVFSLIAEYYRCNDYKKIFAAYFPTSKNTQVSDFYVKMGMSLYEQNVSKNAYQINLFEYKYKPIEYITISSTFSLK